MPSLVAWPVAHLMVIGPGAAGSWFGPTTATNVPERCCSQPLNVPTSVMAKVTGSMVAVSVRLAQTLVPPAAAEDGVAVATSEPPPIARALTRTENTPTIR